MDTSRNIVSRWQGRNHVDDLNGMGLESIMALRLRALGEMTAALEAELLSMESDFFGGERVLGNDITLNFYEAVEEFQKKLLVAMLTLERGSQIRVARRLSLRANTLNMMLKRYGIDAHTYKAEG